MKKYDLEDRLVNFSVLSIEISRSIRSSKEGSYLSDQLMRSGVSPSLNYGEAISGESKRDFIHKLKIVLKELRETYNCLRIIRRTCSKGSETLIEKAIKENDELIAIFVKSIKTLKEKMERDANS